MNPYFYFNGNCREAMETDAEILGDKIGRMMQMKDLPGAEYPEGMGDKVMHARLLLGDQMLLGSDRTEGEYELPRNCYIYFAFDEVEEAKRVYDALANGGEEVMSFGPKPWAKGFGTCRDRFGMPWMINCEQ